jgi:hypothetical protein
MHRLHEDDLRHSMPHDHFAYLRRWLEKFGAAVVVPDPVVTPNNMMPGTFQKAPGRFGVTEPWPPYEPDRQLIEDAKANPPPCA